MELYTHNLDIIKSTDVNFIVFCYSYLLALWWQ